MTAVPLAAGVLAALVTGGAALVAGWGPLGSVLLALGAALAVGAVAHRWSRGRSAAAAHSPSEVALTGRDGTVVTAVPGQAPTTAGAAAPGLPAGRGAGEVTLVVDGHVVRLDACAALPLAVGAPVRVVRVLSPTSVLVEPL